MFCVVSAFIIRPESDGGISVLYLNCLYEFPPAKLPSLFSESPNTVTLQQESASQKMAPRRPPYYLFLLGFILFSFVDAQGTFIHSYTQHEFTFLFFHNEGIPDLIMNPDNFEPEITTEYLPPDNCAVAENCKSSRIWGD